MKEKLLVLTVASLLSGCGTTCTPGDPDCPCETGDPNCPTPKSCESGADGDFIFPFEKGQSWMVCQGYNTPKMSHHGDDIHALDISHDLNAADGSSGCNFSSANASVGQMVYAPADGSMVWTGRYTRHWD